jgi:hypothetical protein
LVGGHGGGIAMTEGVAEGIGGAVQAIGEVVNVMDKVFKLVRSNVVESMPQLASALPPGANPNDPSRWSGWSDQPQALQNNVRYTIDLPLLSDTVFHLGIRFNYGGRVDGQSWTFIKDLEAFVVVDSVTLARDLDISVKFASTGTPINSATTVMLTGSFNVTFSNVIGVEFTEFYGVRVFGNGAAEIRAIT